MIRALYLEVNGTAPYDGSIMYFTNEVADKSFDIDMVVDGFEDSTICRHKYNDKLGRMLDFCGIKTKVELLGVEFMRIPKSSTKSWNTKPIDPVV